jgi:hypothetical protein
MASSWRWASNEEFIEYVHPHALNEVNQVRNYERSYCFAEVCRELFNSVHELETSLSALDEWLGSHREIDADGLSIGVDICHHGETMLLFQRRLAVGMGAYGFLHGKDGIEHFAHKLSSHTTRRDLKQLRTDTAGLLSAFDDAMREDAHFLVDSVRDLPEALERDFRMVRDLCSVGFEDVGLIVCGRGFEKVIRAIMAARGVRISVGKSTDLDASKATLHDLIGAIGRLRWDDDDSLVFSSQSVALMHWIRQVRNEAVHEGEESVAGDERTTATLLAQISGRLWSMHQQNEGRALKAQLLQKEW